MANAVAVMVPPMMPVPAPLDTAAPISVSPRWCISSANSTIKMAFYHRYCRHRQNNAL